MAILAVLIVAFLPMPAYGYIDPGSGHLLIQLILGVGIGLLFHVKRLLAFVRGTKRRASPEEKQSVPKSRAAGE